MTSDLILLFKLANNQKARDHIGLSRMGQKKSEIPHAFVCLNSTFQGIFTYAMFILKVSPTLPQPNSFIESYIYIDLKTKTHKYLIEKTFDKFG